MPWSSLLIALVVMAPGDDSTAGAGSIRERCDVLLREYSDAAKAWNAKVLDAKTPEEARSFVAPDPDAYAAKFLAMARENPDDPGAAQALACVIRVGGARQAWPEVVDTLRVKHARSPWLGDAILGLKYTRFMPNTEPFLRAILRENPDPTTRDQAAFSLADHLLGIEKAGYRFRDDPEAYRFAVSAGGEDLVHRIRDRDPAALHDEAVTLLERLAEHAPATPDPDPRKRTPASHAAARLFKLRELTVGKPAPEIEGKDVDGRPMKLSDHRGKVVVLAWWATWCGGCMAAIPDEKALIRRMEGKPFIFLGINGDEDPERIKAQIRERGIPWDSWYDGGANGPISTRWDITGWPTVYVLDRDGVIRFKYGHEQDKIAEAVESLLGEARP